MDPNQQQSCEEDVAHVVGGDLLVGADAIRAYLIHLGMPQGVDPYYLRRAGRWPIGKTGGSGGSLIASKRKLARHAELITRGSTAAAALELITDLTLRERVNGALACLDEMDGSEAWAIVDRISDGIYHAIKQDPRFASLGHDEFDEQTAAIRERLSQELDERIGGLIAINDVHDVLDRMLEGAE
jgi:hypothetical protein